MVPRVDGNSEIGACVPGCIYSRDGLIAVEIRLKFENMYSTEKLVFW